MNSNRGRREIISKIIKIIITRLSKLILKSILKRVYKFSISDIKTLYFKIFIRLNLIVYFFSKSLYYILKFKKKKKKF